MKLTLRLAAIYNVLWGVWVILFPTALFGLTKMPEPLYLEIWQCVGMIVGVYGIGYWLASNDPIQHYPIVLVGFLGKVFGPIGFLWSLIQGKFPWSFGITIIFNDLIWWIPFGYILYSTYKNKTAQRPLTQG